MIDDGVDEINIKLFIFIHIRTGLVVYDAILEGSSSEENCPSRRKTFFRCRFGEIFIAVASRHDWSFFGSQIEILARKIVCNLHSLV